MVRGFGVSGSGKLRRQRLTIVEIFVVLFVLILIVALWFPFIWHRPDRTKARRVCCMANLKQIGLAVLMYNADYPTADGAGGYFPITPAGNNFEPLNTEGILNDGKVYCCPSAASLATTAANSNYRYVGSGLIDTVDTAAAKRVAYDSSGNHPDNEWMSVLFADGHVEGAKPDGSKTWNRYP